MDFSKYREIANKFLSSSNLMWNKVTFLTVAAVIKEEVDLGKMDSALSEISSRCSKMRRAMSNEVDKLSDEELNIINREYTEIEDLFYKAENRFSLIDDLIYNLKQIKYNYEENEGQKLFDEDLQTDLRESIYIARFK